MGLAEPAVADVTIKAERSQRSRPLRSRTRRGNFHAAGPPCIRRGARPLRRGDQAMPLHDWTDERGWDSVHPVWLTYLLEYVQERLPEGYKAFLGGVPSLTVDSGHGKPDVSVRQWGLQSVAEAMPSSTGVLEPDLEASVVFRLDPQRALHID